MEATSARAHHTSMYILHKCLHCRDAIAIMYQVGYRRRTSRYLEVLKTNCRTAVLLTVDALDNDRTRPVQSRGISWARPSRIEHRGQRMASIYLECTKYIHTVNSLGPKSVPSVLKTHYWYQGRNTMLNKLSKTTVCRSIFWLRSACAAH